MYNSNIHYYLHIVFCVCHPKPNLLWHHILDPLYPLLPRHPTFSSGNHHTVVCVYEFLFVCSLVVFSFIPHICVKSYCSWRLPSDFSCLPRYFQDTSMLLQMAVFHLFLRLSSTSLCMCNTATPLLSIYPPNLKHLFVKIYAPLCSLHHYSWWPRLQNSQSVLW